MNNQEHCQHEFVGYRICCYCGFCKNYEGEIVSPYIISNIKQLADDFEKWYFGIKEQSGKPPLAMQIFYWFSQRMRCKIETDDTTPTPASESRNAQPAKPDEGSGPISIKTTGTVHELKTWPEYFEKILTGEKTFEVRRSDRPFAIGDILALKEWKPSGYSSVSPNKLEGNYTGRETRVKVIYILSGEFVPAGSVVMSIIKETASTDNGKEAKEPVVILNRSQVEEIWDKCERLKGWIIDSELEVEKKTTIDNLFNKQQ